jgi:anhydro-N-acetylmuramic acid kinase
MSGTSLDGIDVAIVDIRGRNITPVAFRSTPYPKAVREAILAVSNAETHTAAISRLNFRLGELYAKAILDTCRATRVPHKSVDLIGLHGQTIFHEGSVSTMQIGEAAVVAERTGIRVVSNFRERDIAAGGKGAPLVPFVDYLLLRHARLNRVALNIGGIANITVIPAGAKSGRVIAFDTGPGNMAIDALVAHKTGGKRRYDRNGAIARSNGVIESLLEELLEDSYYRQKPPKSAGREQYGQEFVARLLATGYEIDDLIATATELTARTIALAIPASNGELIVSGGGVHNPQLMDRLRELLPDMRVESSAAFGIDPDAKEAIAFAILAHERIRGRAANLPSATGAHHAVLLGKIS